MQLLITGGAGYIGSVVTHHLIDHGHDVTVIDDLSTGFAENLAPQADFHQLSIHDVEQVLTPDSDFDGVVHLAGKIEVAESVARPDLYWHANVTGTLALLKAIRTAKTPRLIF